MFDKQHLHIALASDNNYAEFVSIVITSLFENNKSFEKISIHLLSNKISTNSIEKIKHHIPSSGDLYLYDISNIQEQLQIKVPNTIAISAYARLFLSSIIPINISQVLYLDCDVIITNDLYNLWQKNIINYCIAGVLDTLPDNQSKLKIGLNSSDIYFNSGVLLINLDYWRKFNLQEQFINFLLENNGKVHHHDQGIINAVCTNKLILHPRYNLTSTYLSHPYWLLNKTNNPFYSQKEVEHAIETPTIIHFTEGFYNRPWINNSRHPYASIFHKYRNMTLWSNSPLREDKRSIAVKILSWSFLNTPFWCYKMVSNSIGLLHKIVK